MKGGVIERLRELSRIPRKQFEHEGEAPPWQTVATSSQISETENALGFKLPHSLKEIYTQISNGGFGPDYGLMSVSDDEYDPEADDAYIVAHHDLVQRWNAEGEGFRWPAGMISIVDVGCGIRWCLDCSEDELVYFAGDCIDEADVDSFRQAFIRQGISFEQAVIHWLDRKPWGDAKNS